MNISTSLKSEFSLEMRLDAFDGSIRQAKGGKSTRSKFRLTINIVTFDGDDDDRDRAVGKWKRGINRGIVHTGDTCYRSLVSILFGFIFRIRTCKVWKRQMTLWLRMNLNIFFFALWCNIHNCITYFVDSMINGVIIRLIDNELCRYFILT